MRNRNFIKCLSAVLTLWYVVSIIGFDLHICDSTGRKYVSSFLTGMTCEDIHPEHLQSHCCGHDHEACSHDGSKEDSLVEKHCCTDDYQVLSITGSRSGDDEDKFACSSCHCGHCPSLAAVVQNVPVPPYDFPIKDGPCGFLPSYDLLPTYGVWRI